MTSVLFFILTYSIATSSHIASKLQAKKIKYDDNTTPTSLKALSKLNLKLLEFCLCPVE